MVQHLLDKMAGIIRTKKTVRKSFAPDADAPQDHGQQKDTARASVRSAGPSGASGDADPQAYGAMSVVLPSGDGPDLRSFFLDEGARAYISAGTVPHQNQQQSGLQQVPEMSKEMVHNHAVAVAQLIPADLLETVGRENEGLRHRCEEVVRKVEEAATLRQDLAAVFGHVDIILKDLERTKAALAQRTAALAAERDASHDMKARHRQLFSDHDQLRDENVTLLGERQKHLESSSETETQLHTLHETLAEKSKHLADLTRRSEGERERLAQVEIDVRGAREEMQRADDLIFSLQSDFSAARDHATLVEEDNKTLQANLSDARQQIARHARRENETQVILTANKQRIDDLELMIGSERSEHVKTRGLFQGESTSRRAEVSSLQVRLDAMSTRAEANDRLLGETRSQLHTKIEELRKAERRIQELQTASGPLDTRVAGLEQDNRALKQQVAELEAMQLTLTGHTDVLVKSIRAKDKDAVNHKQKIEALTDRYHVEMNRNEEERERLQQTIARLGEQLEKEKLDRAMAEGALDVARKHRLAQSTQNGSLRGRDSGIAQLVSSDVPAGGQPAGDAGQDAPQPVQGEADADIGDVTPLRKSA